MHNKLLFAAAALLCCAAPLTSHCDDLVVELGTGGDDLRGGDDNVHVVLLMQSGSPLRFNNVNARARWADRTVQTITRPLAPTVNIAAIHAVRLETTFGGGVSGDNWNLDSLRVSVRGSDRTRTLLDLRGAPLFRFTGEQSRREFAVVSASRPRRCTTDRECDDGLYCNGVETCVSRPIDGIETWECKTPATPFACESGRQCNEATNSCELPTVDADGDGARSIATGGDDCDDNNPRRYPGAAEVCDLEGLDEDCDFTTGGRRDADNDGHIDAACFNWGPPPGR